MPDWNKIVDEFANLVADRVVERLANSAPSIGAEWPPALETPEVATEEIEVKDERPPVKVSVASHDYDARRVVISKEDVRTLRKKFATVEQVEPSTFATLTKKDLVDKIVAFEQLTGRTIDEEIERLSDIPDDTDIGEVDAEDDDEPVELTRESMLELDLPKLREIAADQGIDPEKLTGLDVEAVVAVIYGDEVPEQDEESDSYTKDEIEGMSLAELKRLADDLIDQGAPISYDRSTDRDVLISGILKLLEL